jgi:hypothetical protein
MFVPLASQYSWDGTKQVLEWNTRDGQKIVRHPEKQKNPGQDGGHLYERPRKIAYDAYGQIGQGQSDEESRNGGKREYLKQNALIDQNREKNNRDYEKSLCERNASMDHQ